MNIGQLGSIPVSGSSAKEEIRIEAPRTIMGPQIRDRNGMRWKVMKEDGKTINEK